MKKQEYRHSIIHCSIQVLKPITRQAHLLNPESMRTGLSSMHVSDAREAKVVEDLAGFYRWKHIPFEKLNHRRIDRLQIIPLLTDVDQVISSFGIVQHVADFTPAKPAARETSRDVA